MKKNFANEDVRICAPENLKRKWYIEHYFEGRRKRIYGELNQLPTYEARMTAALAMRKDLVNNYTPPVYDRDRLWEFIESQRGRWRQKTHDTYASKARVFIQHLGDRPITADVVVPFFDQLAKDVHKTTYNTYLRQLKRLFGGVGAAHTLDGLDKLNAHSTPAKYFQTRPRNYLKEYIRDHDYTLHMFCQFLYYLFLRPNSELRLMKRSDFDLDRWRAYVRPEVSKNGKYEFVAIPKAFRKELVIFLSEYRPSDWIFPGIFDKDNPIGVNTLPGRHKSILRKLGFGPEYKLYSWKHTGAIACVEAGIHPKILQKQLRHANLEMTDRYLQQLGVFDFGQIENLFPAY